MKQLTDISYCGDLLEEWQLVDVTRFHFSTAFTHNSSISAYNGVHLKRIAI